jgi:hypothetical protein
VASSQLSGLSEAIKGLENIFAISLVQKRNCHAGYILSEHEGLAMTKTGNDEPIGSLRGLPAVVQEGA